MCVKWTDKIRTAKEDIIAYKRTGYDRRSFWPALARTLQGGYKQKGDRLEYFKGATVSSPMPETPGIYLYTENYSECDNDGDLKVKIPAGTRYRRGRYGAWHGAKRTINAEEIVVLE